MLALEASKVHGLVGDEVDRERHEQKLREGECEVEDVDGVEARDVHELDEPGRGKVEKHPQEHQQPLRCRLALVKVRPV